MADLPDAGFAEKVKSGDQRMALEAMRDKLADSMAKADPNVIAQIAARLQAVLTELAALPAVERTEVDDLIERRKARRARTDAELRARQQRGA
jgi:hypothetical protein